MSVPTVPIVCSSVHPQLFNSSPAAVKSCIMDHGAVELHTVFSKLLYVYVCCFIKFMSVQLHVLKLDDKSMAMRFKSRSPVK